MSADTTSIKPTAPTGAHPATTTPLRAEPFCGPALGHLLEARRLLQELVDNGRVEEGGVAWGALHDYLPDAIASLTANEEDAAPTRRPLLTEALSEAQPHITLVASSARSIAAVLEGAHEAQEASSAQVSAAVTALVDLTKAAARAALDATEGTDAQHLDENLAGRAGAVMEKMFRVYSLTSILEHILTTKPPQLDDGVVASPAAQLAEAIVELAGVDLGHGLTGEIEPLLHDLGQGQRRVAP